jgi:hypothetical protein
VQVIGHKAVRKNGKSLKGSRTLDLLPDTKTYAIAVVAPSHTIDAKLRPASVPGRRVLLDPPDCFDPPRVSSHKLGGRT